jgi:hypothetical protein
MANITWDMPATFTLNTPQTMRDCITDLDTQLKSLGLVDYDSGNVARIAAMDITAGNITSLKSYANEITVGYVSYKLPQGNGNVTYSDPVTQTGDKTYVTITRASYDDTPVYIKFVFSLKPVANNTTITAANVNSFVNFRCTVYVANNSSYINAQLSYFIMASSNATYTTAANYNKYVSTKCYASINENSFFLYWFNKAATAKYSDNNDGIMMSTRFTICMMLYRKNGRISLVGPQGTTTNLYDQSSFLYPYYSYIDIYGNVATTNTSSGWCPSWPFNVSTLKADGNLRILPTLHYTSTSYNQNPHLWICSQITGDGSPVVNTLLVKQNGNYVLRKFLNLSSMSGPSYRPLNSASYAFVVAFDDYPCTTNPL